MRKLRCRKAESHGWDPSATGSQILNLEGLAPKPLSLLRASQDAAASKVSEQTLRIEGIRTEDVVKGVRGPGAGPLQELVLSCREGLVFGKPGLQHKDIRARVRVLSGSIALRKLFCKRFSCASHSHDGLSGLHRCIRSLMRQKAECLRLCRFNSNGIRALPLKHDH